VSPGPDAGRARATYEREAGRYDGRVTVRGIKALQRRAIDALELSSGDRVLDVACGTGLAFAELEERVGSSGVVVGVDLTAAMLGRAAERVRAHGWDNVRLVEARVEEADIGDPGSFDAALFSFTHDVLQSDAAVDAVVRAVRPGGRIATTGIQWAPRWLLPVNAAVYLGARRWVTTLNGFDRPFRRMEDRLVDVRVERAWLGAMYVVSGRVPPWSNVEGATKEI
jgi:ubiquinone/menaquinone biosynthesis C-methylase UbiE